MEDQISPEFKQRIKDALRRADDSVKGKSVEELNELAEKGCQMVNEE